jgi:2-polyprenyl-6-methoxyphenol hydroxylase-like FAD-dependent oxidoreductase
MYNPRIAISGAGPGGLTLARLLHLRQIPCTVFDLRAKPTQEEISLPSGMLDLHEETGLGAIKACGLEEGFKAALGDCSEAIIIRNPAGEMLYSAEDSGESYRPEIPRLSLVDLLVKSLPEGCVRWSTKLQSVSSEKLADGRTEMNIDLGESGSFKADLVIGADGAWSKSRRYLTPVKPSYTGIHYLTVTARHISRKYAHIVNYIGSGASFALGDGNAIMTHRGPQDSMRTYVAVKTPHEDWAVKMGLKGLSAARVKEKILGKEGLFGNWSEELKEIISVACDEDTKDRGEKEPADLRPLYTLPSGEKWSTQPGITLLGDAAHLMAPNGEGVNSAMADALDLANCISSFDFKGDSAAEWQVGITAKIKEYEEMVQQRAKGAFADTDELLGIMHGENGAQALRDMFKSFEQGPPGVRPSANMLREG